MRQIVKITAVVTLLLSVIACKNDSQPNYQYMPNMYVSVPYDTYGKYNIFPEGYEALKPADGSIARGWMPYNYENNIDGFDSAKANLTNPLAYTEDNLEVGKALYDIYCAICHGAKGKGDGYLGLDNRELILPGSYGDKDITEGSVYHVMYYGKGLMGSYASQMTEEEMWKVDHYVMSLKNDLDGKAVRPFDVVEDIMVDELHLDEAHAIEDHDGDEHHSSEDNDESH